jgi:hypothetical protein
MHASTPDDYKERSIPVPQFVMARLVPRLQGRVATSPIFPGALSGGPLRNRSLRRYVLDAAASEVGHDGLTPHELRHICVSLAVSAGANVKASQRMLWHSSQRSPWTPTRTCSMTTWTALRPPSTVWSRRQLWAKCGQTQKRPVLPQTSEPASSRTNTGYGKVCPQEDSNLRPCLRRAVLYPLSYGGQGARERGSRVAPATRPAVPTPRAGSADAFPLPGRLPAPAQARHARMDAGRPPRRPGTAAHPIPSRGDHP